MNRLIWWPRGAYLRQKDSTYDGLYDDIDQKYGVEAAAINELEFEVSEDPAIGFCATAAFMDYARSWRKHGLPTREAARAWCESMIDEARAEGLKLVDISSKFEPGIYFLLSDYDASTYAWTLVFLTKDHSNGLAKIWFFGSDIHSPIDQVNWASLMPANIKAPDGKILT